MFGAGIAKTLVGTAVGVLSAVRDVALHGAWYVRHQIGGAAREEPPPGDPDEG